MNVIAFLVKTTVVKFNEESRPVDHEIMSFVFLISADPSKVNIVDAGLDDLVEFCSSLFVFQVKNKFTDDPF